MDVAALASKLNLQVRTASNNLKNKISGGYTGDLLSDVMANSREGDIWITRQVHLNIVAVASLKDLAGIILVNASEPAPDTLEKAAEANIPLLVSEMSAFTLTGKIFNLLAENK